LKKEPAPFTHSLSPLAGEGGFYDAYSDDHREFIDHLESMNIEASYPSHEFQKT
jgi:hypothetical protein